MPFFADIDTIKEVFIGEGAWGRVGGGTFWATIIGDCSTSYSVWITKTHEDAERVAKNGGRGYFYEESGLSSPALAVAFAKERLSRKRRLLLGGASPVANQTPGKFSAAGGAAAGAVSPPAAPATAAKKKDVACGGDPFEELFEQNRKLAKKLRSLEAREATAAAREAALVGERDAARVNEQLALARLGKIKSLLSS